MNTAKQVNMMIGLLMVGLVGTLFYYMFDNGISVFGVDFGNREAHAAERQELTNAERGAALFARYCRACHGLTGTGAAERPGLPGAALNTPTNYPPGLADSQVSIRQQRLTSTIHCGRVGTQMPPWSTDEGGALNFFQIQQLVTLITSKYAPEAWDHVIEVGNGDPTHGGDRLDPSAALAQDISATDTQLKVTNATAINKDTLLRIGLDEPGEPYELFVVKDVDKTNNTVTVERGPDATLAEQKIGSTAIAHKAGSTIYNGPQLPTGQITGDPNSEAAAPCGQNKAAPAAASQPVNVATGATVTIGDNFFQVDSQHNPEMDVAAGAAISLTFNNTGSSPHNFRLAGPDSKFDTADDIVSQPDAISSGQTGAITFTLTAGTYLYDCQFHPDQMKGEVVAK